jgi:hypothetical protein
LQCGAVGSDGTQSAGESLDGTRLLIHRLRELLHALVMKQSCERDRQLRLAQRSLCAPELRMHADQTGGAMIGVQHKRSTGVHTCQVWAHAEQ